MRAEAGGTVPGPGAVGERDRLAAAGGGHRGGARGELERRALRPAGGELGEEEDVVAHVVLA